MKRGWVVGLTFILSMTIFGCINAALPIPTPMPSLTAITASTSTPTIIPTQSPIPTIISNPQIVILADNLPEPDDLLLGPDGSIYISDVGDETIRRYRPDGNLEVVLSGLNEPEGMVILPDGSLVIAEQGTNRLIRYDLVNRTLQPFLNLQNQTNQLGVDGLAFDAQTQTIIVPDSPNGTILRVSIDGQSVTQIASGFARPTGAWVEADGSILVVDENGNSLNRIHRGGSIEKLADLSIPDDVIEDASGNIFVNTIGDNAIHLVSSATHQDTILISDIVDPQGIIFDTEGNLIVTDPGHHRLIKLIIH
ncbi:MAG TPA: NHL repeat-containing protein [Anaerolineales bacterium]|jgi:sugar lactone lactonase YvrE|nr:NHL repeat-containing protein [Anaerolineales bacterium]